MRLGAGWSRCAADIGVCQYRRMSNSLMVLSPADMAACCPPLSSEPLSAEQAGQVAPLLKALADPVRLRLMSLIASHPGGEACVCDLPRSLPARPIRHPDPASATILGIAESRGLRPPPA